ncbi:MAG: YfhO family protein [Desulfobacteraceae bacterium]|nr:YfhO family protein [Desulfobacteraceae bacterium]
MKFLKAYKLGTIAFYLILFLWCSFVFVKIQDSTIEQLTGFFKFMPYAMGFCLSSCFVLLCFMSAERDEISNRSGKTWLIIVLFLAGLIVVFFGEVLFFSNEKVLSKQYTDLHNEYVFSRDFGFSQLRQGNLALWNPHIFSGVPFFGGFQSALFYPLNFVYLIFPLPKAINIGIILHVFLAGIFMYLWTARRGLHPVACLVSAILFMFCGPHFLHIFAGHLSNLCTMAWAPLVFLSTDGWVEDRSPGWFLIGIFAVTMQIFAGHPQYVFYTAIGAGIYTSLLIINKQVDNRERLFIATGFAGIYVSAALLSAVQLITGIQSGAESLRSMGVPYKFAASFSFAPENIITLLAPNFFGNMGSVQYWGRWFIWEMMAFISVTGFVLCLYAVFRADRNTRKFLFVTALILFVLALGKYTPLFQLLYSFVFGFDKFRGNSKFIILVCMFLIMSAGIGLDCLIRKEQAKTGSDSRTCKNTIIFLFAAASVLVLSITWIRYSSATGDQQGGWASVLQALYKTGECFYPAKYTEQDFIRKTGNFAFESLLTASCILFILAVFFCFLKFSKKTVYLIALLAITEILFFAKGFRTTFDISSTLIPEVGQIRTDRGEYRIFNSLNANSAMTFNMKDIWGCDPSISLRYAQFIKYTQDGQPDKASENLYCSDFHQLYRMLRCRFVVGVDSGRIRVREIKGKIMPRVCLIGKYKFIRDRDRIFAEMDSPLFAPEKAVILETLPKHEPVDSEDRGTVTLADISTDQMIIEADLPHPAILLITDGYSKHWKAVPLPGSDQQTYDIMPANYILKAIPLRQGHHNFSMEYSPSGFYIGKRITIISLIFYICGLIWYVRQRIRTE